MCSCEKHHDETKPCTCICPEHGNFQAAFDLAMVRYDEIVRLRAELDDRERGEPTLCSAAVELRRLQQVWVTAFDELTGDAEAFVRKHPLNPRPGELAGADWWIGLGRVAAWLESLAASPATAAGLADDTDLRTRIEALAEVTRDDRMRAALTDALIATEAAVSLQVGEDVAGDDGPECETCGKTTCPDAQLESFSAPVNCQYAPIYEALKDARDCDYGCARDLTNQGIRLYVVPAVERIVTARIEAGA